MLAFLRRDNVIINIMITLVAVSPAFALGEGNRNLLLIGAMCLSPYFFLRYPVIIPKVDVPLVLLCDMMIAFPLAFHPDTMRWSTVLYSCMFCMYLMAFVRLLIFEKYEIGDFSQLLKGLIYAYCVVLIIQQFCVLTGLPIFNISNYSPKEPWKLNSLMSEPSHSARIIPVLMYVFICCEKEIKGTWDIKRNIKEERFVWSAFLWSLVTMGSSTAFIFLSIIIAKSISIKKILTSIIVAVVAIGVLFYSENKTVVRVQKLTKATLTLDEHAILRADGSGSYRIVPTIRGAKAVSLTDFDGWFGHGIDADVYAIKPLPGTDSGHAGSFYLWYNYGFLVSILFWMFSLYMCVIKKDPVSILVWLLCVFAYGGLNNQIIWLTIILLYTYKYLTDGKYGVRTPMGKPACRLY